MHTDGPQRFWSSTIYLHLSVLIKGGGGGNLTKKKQRTFEKIV